VDQGSPSSTGFKVKIQKVAHKSCWIGSLLAMAGLMAGAPVRAAILGDLNGDDRVTVQDAVRLTKIMAFSRAPSSYELLYGDCSPVSAAGNATPSLWTFGDGRISSDDVAAVLRYAAGIEPPREIGMAALTLAGSGPTVHQSVKKVAAQNSLLVEDGPANSIYLWDPWDLALAPTGEIYFTEYIGNRIRVLETDGAIRTLAGSLTRGYIDASGSRARFDGPMGLALLPDGSLVVADSANHAIRKVTPQGVVTTLAGNGRNGSRNGRGSGATFYTPNGVATDPYGNVYVADSDNSLIRKIDPTGQVTTLAGSQRGFDDGPASVARFKFPSGVLYDPRDGGVFVVDMGNNRIRKVTADSQVVTLAGNGEVGHLDGAGPDAEFFYPYGIDLDPQGRLWIADWLNQSVRILTPDGTVKTIAGQLPESYVDGPASYAKFKGLMNVRVGPSGRVYLADTDNERIRVLIP
jgi:sugar lactone lactonase YvrE